MELEYNLICDFIKLRNELGLSQQKNADECGAVREMIAVIENRKKSSNKYINKLKKDEFLGQGWVQIVPYLKWIQKVEIKK